MSLETYQAVIGGRIRSLRKANGLSQTQLATLAGLAVPALSLIENGKRDVKLSTFVRLADALRVDVAAFFRDAEDPAGQTARRPAGDGEGYDLGDDA